MTSYPNSFSHSPALTDESTLQSAVDCLEPHLPLELNGPYGARDILAILLRAASRGDSIEQTVRTLSDTPSSNTIRYHLAKFQDLSLLEGQLNTALQSRIPAKIQKRPQRMAIDLHLIPYYGSPSEVNAPYIYRSQAKSGTTHFFAYATIYVIRRNQRVTLGVHAVPRDETLVATVTYLLAMLTPLKVTVSRLYLDRGFYCVPVIRWLKALDIPFLMPGVVRGKEGGTRALLKGRKSYATDYTIQSPKHGSVTCEMKIVCGYQKGFKQQHGMRYSLYVAYRVKVALHQLHHYYRERFGIETSYRIKNTCRIRTTTKNPILRLLFVVLAFILVNLWIYLLWYFVSSPRRGGQIVHKKLFPLKTMLEFLAHAVERRFPVITDIYLPLPN
jgi:Transposase DDE domain